MGVVPSLTPELAQSLGLCGALPHRATTLAISARRRPAPRVPGDAMDDRGEQPVREVGGERWGLRARAGGGEPELVDLRLYRPRPDVVIVRVSGTVGGVTAPVLAERVGKQLDRAPHVVLDLGDVHVLGPQGLTVLLMLHQQAMARGVELHIVGVEHDAVRRPLHARGLAQLVRLDSTVDAVIAALPRPVISRGGSGRIGPDGDDPKQAGGLGPDHARPLGQGRRPRPCQSPLSTVTEAQRA